MTAKAREYRSKLRQNLFKQLALWDQKEKDMKVAFDLCAEDRAKKIAVHPAGTGEAAEGPTRPRQRASESNERGVKVNFFIDLTSTVGDHMIFPRRVYNNYMPELVQQLRPLDLGTLNPALQPVLIQ